MESHTPSARQKTNADPISEKAEQVNLLSEEEEKDPLALDTAIEQPSSRNKLSNNAKHSHSLRRHVPRIIVKPIPPEKKVTATATATLSSNASTSTTAATTVINATSGKNTTPSPSSRATSSRRAQQQAKAAAAAAAAASAAAAAAASSASLPTPITAITQASTMREVLASIPAAQIEQTKDGKIDLETPDSILASTNLRALLNKQTFSMLPPLYQYNLIQLLPSVDREAIEIERKTNTDSTVTMDSIKLGPSSLNNEFFARACLEWVSV
ncbi:unnamed protein product [Ceratitis capitata]|uniref:(Mediterranean fruit fly) hypothetical protein n=1 Tax=Ceratitis capitata TaxID=7213 RepID=A0A811VAL9_CERCA|nr:unnamed protein product [Ceratitis capitata]